MYKMLYRPGHYRSDVTGMVAIHILVAEEVLGRPLVKGELVHHKDFNKLNNKPTNLLFPITRAEHQKLPEYHSRFILAKGLYKEFLAWWIQEQKNDESNAHIVIVERKLVKEQNARERMRKHGDV